MSAGSLVKVFQAAILLAVFLDKTASDQILQLLVGAEAKHFLPPTYRVAGLQILVNNLKEIIEPKGLFVRKNGDQFVCDVIRHPA